MIKAFPSTENLAESKKRLNFAENLMRLMQSKKLGKKVASKPGVREVLASDLSLAKMRKQNTMIVNLKDTMTKEKPGETHSSNQRLDH